MKTNSLIRTIQQSIKHFKLDLTGLNVLIPIHSKEPAILPILASLAGSKNVYVVSQDALAINKVSICQEKLESLSNIQFIQKETAQILSGIDIILKGDEISPIDAGYISTLKKDCVISIFPSNLDFLNINDINMEECTNNKIPVVAVNPNDQHLMLYKYISQIVIKRFYELNLDVFRSKVILIGSGELFENVMSVLKACGANVYAAYTNEQQDKSYILKHLADTDAIVVADYPQQSDTIIGTEGFITTEEILNINPEVKIVHLAGKMQTKTLEFGRVSFTPNIINQATLSINNNDLGAKSISDIAAAALKVGETIINIKNRTVLSSESVISYTIVNANGPIVLGRVMF